MSLHNYYKNDKQCYITTPEIPTIEELEKFYGLIYQKENLAEPDHCHSKLRKHL